MTKLAILESIPVRKIWQNEAKHFTPWLEKNASLLFEEIGITAENIKREENAGRYSVDITAEENQTQKKIIVENQLERTDHDHLGKLLTYASSLDACIIVWVVRDFTEEHQKAIEWFNDHMDDEIAFFLVKVEAYRIENSKPAPKFNVVVEPNSWSKILKGSGTTKKEITTTKLNHLRFWEGFKEFASNSDTDLNISRKPRPQAWYDISIGSSEAHISLSLNTIKGQLYADIYITNNQKLYNSLFQKKEQFQEIVKGDIEWLPLENKQASRIRCTLSGNPHDESKQEGYFVWMLNRSNEFAKAFREGTQSS